MIVVLSQFYDHLELLHDLQKVTGAGYVVPVVGQHFLKINNK
jgi:hypothetical protein